MSPLRTLTVMLAFALAGTAAAAEITVTTVDDGLAPDGSCSLREALLAAELDAAIDACAAGESGAADRIGFGQALFSGGDTATIALTDTLDVAGGSVSLALERDVEVTIAATGTFAILEVALDAGAAFGIDGGPGWIELSGGTGGRGGGALGFASGASLSLSRVRLSGNVGGFGGAVTVDSASTVAVTLQAVEALGNESTGDGGVLAVRAAGASVELVDASAVDNRSTGFGGAIALVAADTGTPQLRLEVRASRFDGNLAASGGGAVAVLAAQGGVPTLQLDVVDSRFDLGSALSGGAILVSDGGNADAALQVRVDNSRFRQNSALDHGGALWVGRSQGGTAVLRELRLRRNSFIQNTAQDGGGAVVSEHMDLEMENNLFVFNDGRTGIGAVHHLAEPKDPTAVLAIVANTFIGNLSDEAQSVSQFSIDVPQNVMVPARFEANLVEPYWPSDDISCVLNGAGHLGTARWNAAHIAASGDCTPGSDPLRTEDLGLPAIGGLVGDALHPVHVVPQPGSPLIDAWPEPDCLSLTGGLLTTDLVGPRRLPPEGVPVDGDGVDPADCDIGAFEAPDPDAARVFADGFEPPA